MKRLVKQSGARGGCDPREATASAIWLRLGDLGKEKSDKTTNGRRYVEQ